MCMDTNSKGTVGLAAVMFDLTKRGYSLFLPMADTTSVDLIACNVEMQPRRLQVKYRSLQKGAIHIPVYSVVGGKMIPINTQQIDVWAIYCPDNQQVYYMPTSYLSSKKNSITLRVELSRKAQHNAHLAENFLDMPQ